MILSKGLVRNSLTFELISASGRGSCLGSSYDSIACVTAVILCLCASLYVGILTISSFYCYFILLFVIAALYYLTLYTNLYTIREFKHLFYILLEVLI